MRLGGKAQGAEDDKHTPDQAPEERTDTMVTHIMDSHCMLGGRHWRPGSAHERQGMVQHAQNNARIARVASFAYMFAGSSASTQPKLTGYTPCYVWRSTALIAARVCRSRPLNSRLVFSRDSLQCVQVRTTRAQSARRSLAAPAVAVWAPWSLVHLGRRQTPLSSILTTLLSRLYRIARCLSIHSHVVRLALGGQGRERTILTSKEASSGWCACSLHWT